MDSEAELRCGKSARSGLEVDRHFYIGIRVIVGEEARPLPAWREADRVAQSVGVRREPDQETRRERAHHREGPSARRSDDLRGVMRPAAHGPAETRRYCGEKMLVVTVSISTPGPAPRGMVWFPVST